MKALIQRENEIFSILREFEKSGLRYVLIGGYAVSAYMHRFSIDADLCIGKKDIEAFREMLKSRKFEIEKRMALEDAYSGEFECYTKRSDFPVTVDLMINSVVSRQTNDSMSFEEIYKSSKNARITGIEEEADVRIPSKEVLIALKIQAARLTDARDIVALCKDIDFNEVAKYAKRGNLEKISINLDILLKLIESDNFKDSFKGVFSIEKLPKGNIENAIKLLEKLKKAASK